MLLPAVFIQQGKRPDNIGTVGAGITLVDRQAWDWGVPLCREQASLLRRINPRPLEHCRQGSLTEGWGGRRWVGAMTGPEVG